MSISDQKAKQFRPEIRPESILNILYSFDIGLNVIFNYFFGLFSCNLI